VGLILIASIFFGIVLFSFFISLSAWFTVYSAYSVLGRYSGYSKFYDAEVFANTPTNK
jgi:hypothetical protein